MVLFAFAVIAQSARADGLSGLYIGGNAGKARIDTDNALYQRQLESSAEGFGSVKFTNSSLDNRSTAWWVNTGYMVWSYVGIEASYFHLGELHDQAAGTFTPTGGTSKSLSASTVIRSQGPALGIVFRLPLAESIDIDFRLADYYARSTLTNTAIIAASTTTATVTKSSSSLLLGLGAAYTFGGHWSAKLDYTRVEQAKISTTEVKYDVDMLSAGVRYTF
jgi:opacity protein-like surface antigen